MIVKGFIVFEGIDGSGTTTQIKALFENLSKKLGNDKVISTAEPTNKQTGLFLRKILKGEIEVAPQTAAYLFSADRCEHVYGKDGILESTKQGKIVLSDRYFFSSLAYQCVTCGDDLPRLLNSVFPLPEILFYFKIDAEKSIKRVASRGKTVEIYEKLDFQKQTQDAYEKIISEYNKTQKGETMKIITINAEKSIEEIKEEIWQTVKNLV